MSTDAGRDDEDLEDALDVAEATRVLAALRDGTESVIPWDDLRRELGLA